MPVEDTTQPADAKLPRTDPAFALSVDVEDYYQVRAFAGRVRREEWTRYPARVVENTERLLDLFDGAGSRGTFFVLGCVAQRHPEIVRRIAERGHEIASHGVSHKMVTELTREELLREAVESKALLEDLSGSAVIGFRAPSYSINRETLWALETLAEAGYQYDSSVYPIKRKAYGYPDGPTCPTRLRVGRREIAEFPLPWVPIGPLRLPVLAGAYLRLLPSWVSLAATRYHLARRIPLVVNVHPWEIDPGQPTIGRSRIHTWTHYARLGKTAAILSRVLRSARFAGVASRLSELRLLDGRPMVGGRG